MLEGSYDAQNPEIPMDCGPSVRWVEGLAVHLLSVHPQREAGFVFQLLQSGITLLGGLV